MRITMLALGSTGDVRPYTLLGQELRARGHQVTIASFSRFAGMVEEAGITFFPVSGDAEKLMAAIMASDAAGLGFLPHFEKSVREIVPELIQDLSDSCAGADAMICNFFGSVYYSIAEKYRIPCIQTHYFPMDPTHSFPISSVKHQRMGPWLNSATYRIGYLLIGVVERRLLSSWRREHALSPRKVQLSPDYRIGDHVIPVIYAISPLLLPRPAEWDSHIRMSGFWMEEHPAPWQPPAELEAFLARNSRTVYIGFGSMNSGDMNRLMSIVLRAVHAAGLSAVISAGWGGKKMKCTRRVHFTDYVPHDWLFPRVCAVVHHGGAGTTAAGLRYGKPTLVIPFAGDQPLWGFRVHETGCGPKPLARGSLTVPRLTRALLELTGRPEYRIHAEALAEGLRREHGVRTAADMIEEEISRW